MKLLLDVNGSPPIQETHMASGGRISCLINSPNEIITDPHQRHRIISPHLTLGQPLNLLLQLLPSGPRESWPNDLLLATHSRCWFIPQWHKTSISLCQQTVDRSTNAQINQRTIIRRPKVIYWLAGERGAQRETSTRESKGACQSVSQLGRGALSTWSTQWHQKERDRSINYVKLETLQQKKTRHKDRKFTTEPLKNEFLRGFWIAISGTSTFLPPDTQTETDRPKAVEILIIHGRQIDPRCWTVRSATK